MIIIIIKIIIVVNNNNNSQHGPFSSCLSNRFKCLCLLFSCSDMLKMMFLVNQGSFDWLITNSFFDGDLAFLTNAVQVMWNILWTSMLSALWWATQIQQCIKRKMTEPKFTVQMQAEDLPLASVFQPILAALVAEISFYCMSPDCEVVSERLRLSKSCETWRGDVGISG